MTLSPIDVAQQQFSRSFHGVNAREVESFLRSVAHAMTALVQKNADAQANLLAQLKKVEVLERRENDVKEALVLAQKAVDELRGQAEREASLKIEQAEVKARQIVAEAQERNVSLTAQVKDLLRQRIRFVEELRGLIATHARLLDLHVADAPQLARQPSATPSPQAGNDVLAVLQAPPPPQVDDPLPGRRTSRIARPERTQPHAANE